MADTDDELTLKQLALFETFFNLLGYFSFDKAKEFLEKERDAASKSHLITPFLTTVLSSFVQLAGAEKNYASLIFLGPKGFRRKDSSLKVTYELLKNEFQRLEDKRYVTPVSTPTISPTLSSRTPSPTVLSPSPSASSEASTSAVSSLSSNSVSHSLTRSTSSLYHWADICENLASHLCGQLQHFAVARMEMMELYEKMCTMSNVRFMNSELLLGIISEIVRTNQKLFHHPLLNSLKSSFTNECEILMKLLECQVHMQYWRFLPSLLCLQEAHTKLAAWNSSPKEIKKGSSTTSIRPPAMPQIYQWLCSLKFALVSKFTLYFHEILSKQSTPQEMRNICSKTTVDYFQKIVTFQKRYDAMCVAIVLDTNGLDDFRGHGYVHPDKYYETPKGLNSYPAIVCYPPEKPVSHWPSVVMIMDNEENRLKNSDVVPFFDKKVNSTYFFAKVESRMTLIAIFDSKKSENDAHITRFMSVLCNQLRCNKIFACLKPGSK